MATTRIDGRQGVIIYSDDTDQGRQTFLELPKGTHAVATDLREGMTKYSTISDEALIVAIKPESFNAAETTPTWDFDTQWFGVPRLNGLNDRFLVPDLNRRNRLFWADLPDAYVQNMKYIGTVKDPAVPADPKVNPTLDPSFPTAIAPDTHANGYYYYDLRTYIANPTSGDDPIVNLNRNGMLVYDDAVHSGSTTEGWIYRSAYASVSSTAVQYSGATSLTATQNPPLRYATSATAPETFQHMADYLQDTKLHRSGNEKKWGDLELVDGDLIVRSGIITGPTVSTSLKVTGNTIIGTNSANTLTVNATASVVNELTTGTKTNLGSTASDTLTVNATSNFKGDTTITKKLITTPTSEVTLNSTSLHLSSVGNITNVDGGLTVAETIESKSAGILIRNSSTGGSLRASSNDLQWNGSRVITQANSVRLAGDGLVYDAVRHELDVQISPNNGISLSTATGKEGLRVDINNAPEVTSTKLTDVLLVQNAAGTLSKITRENLVPNIFQVLGGVQLTPNGTNGTTTDDTNPTIARGIAPIPGDTGVSFIVSNGTPSSPITSNITGKAGDPNTTFYAGNIVMWTSTGAGAGHWGKLNTSAGGVETFNSRNGPVVSIYQDYKDFYPLKKSPASGITSDTITLNWNYNANLTIGTGTTTTIKGSTLFSVQPTSPTYKATSGTNPAIFGGNTNGAYIQDSSSTSVRRLSSGRVGGNDNPLWFDGTTEHVIYNTKNANITSAPWKCSTLTATTVSTNNFVSPGTTSANYGTAAGGGRLVISNTFATLNTSLSVTGEIRSSQNVIGRFSSDERIKSEITEITNPLDKVCSLRASTYIKNGKNETGLIAQDVEKVIENLVYENGDGIKGIQTGGYELVALLVGAIKELKAEIDELKKK